MLLTIFLMFLSVKENESVEDLFDVGNRTSCDEFLNGSTFDPTLLLDVNWKIFYSWHIEYEQSYQIHFSTPSDELIKRFKQEMDGNMKPPVDWSDAEFFMESSIDISALYIKTNTSGVYRIIPVYALKMEAVPVFLIGMKLIEPGYLGLMNCIHRLCYVLAPVEKMPPVDEIEEIALKLKFQGALNFTYVMPSPPVTPPPHDEGDQDDAIEQDLDKFDFI